MGNMCDNFIIYEDNKNEFQIWQGLIGAHFTPHVDDLGNLSWTNNGYLPNPETVNVSGRGLTIAGIVATTGDLPETATNYDTYLVGTASPYHGYIYDDGSWYDLGVMGVGEPAGFGTPTATIDGGTGTPSVTITASGDNTAKVFAFAFSNLKGEDGQDGVGVPPSGTTGQVLAKASNTSYDTEWITPSAGIDPATATPLMDGTAAVGSSAKYAREDHVHPLYNQLVRPNLLDNWYFVGGGSQLGGGKFPINQRGQLTYSGAVYGIDRFEGESSSAVTVNSDYVSFTGTTIQFLSLAQLKELAGKTVTISALQYYNGQTYLLSASGTVNPHTQDTTIEANIHGGGLLSFRVFANSGSYQACRIWSNSTVNLIAVKLELGTTQTLAHQENGTWVLNEIPNYEEQLIRCNTSTVDVSDTYANKVVAYTNEVGGALYFTSVAVSATTGDIVSLSNAEITADHVPASVVFANPSAITTNLTWTSASGSFKLNGTCSSATTCEIVLVKKNN